jgi:zinc protease
MRLFSFVACMMMALAVPSYAASPALTPHEFTLKNGLRVIVVPVHRSPVISHNLLIHAGAADDALGHSGVAHFLEHMFFKGTPTTPEGEYSKQVERMGGRYNAFTSADMTGYYVTIAKLHLPQIMALEADRMMHLAPVSKVYGTERDVVLEERRMRTDNSPAALLSEAVDAALFRHHPYGTPVIGWAHEMALLNEASAKAFLARFYTPHNAVLLLVGDIEEAEARTLAERYYGAWQGAAALPRNWVSEPPRITSETVTLRHPTVKVAQWTRTYIAPSFGGDRKDTATRIMPLIVAEEILGHPRTGVLYKEMVEKRKLATSVSVGYNPYVIGPGTVQVSITPTEGVNMRQFTKAYAEIMQAFKAGKIDAKVMERARNQLKATTIFARDSIQGMAAILSQLTMIGLPPEWFNQWGALVDGVTPEQVTHAVTETFTDNIAVTGLLLPSGKAAPASALPRVSPATPHDGNIQ